MPADNVAFAGSIPENYDRYLGPVLFEPYARDLLARINVPEYGTLLEVACGTGIVTKQLRDRLAPSVRIVATDLNEAMISFARQKFRSDNIVICSDRRKFGVRWQAKRDTALDQTIAEDNPKRRRRSALPAHSK